jgi:hypothetical protein
VRNLTREADDGNDEAGPGKEHKAPGLFLFYHSPKTDEHHRKFEEIEEADVPDAMIAMGWSRNKKERNGKKVNDVVEILPQREIKRIKEKLCDNIW